MTNDSSLITTEVSDKILRIGIARPEKRNALTMAMYDAMSTALEATEQDRQVRVILLHGTASCFTSGNDLSDFAKHPPQGENSPVFRFLRTISQTTKPLLAMVSGPAVGIGTTMLLHCDLVYADETARFQLPFVNLGLCPEAASSYLLPRRIGPQRAADMLLLGEMVDAATALEYGLINQLFDSATLEDQVLAKATRLAAQPPEAVRLTKSLLKEQQQEPIANVMRKEGALFLQQLAKPEAQEAISAFLQRRKADFSQFS
ncbi:enoyl-CoA hydratase [Pelovirga terrestris]|uniref:Enoyl-CoA hydratase n=1 Tax=Pelovirga terrestris TaxID=2771352 RepID=A0A8J6UHZ6_9BACT|nr:enoyl-CoA hydratase [Pelovirga terrestris]MBD1400020.1 enoyl-CoA hydratase [Pelovirga terrestris]